MEAVVADRRHSAPSGEELPFTLPLELTVTDPEVIVELVQRPEGRHREDYALSALRLGVLALKQARGQVDAQTLKLEGERLLGEVGKALTDHRTHLDRTLTETLRNYFDPTSGRFNERIDRLLKKDGELESLLHRKITAADSEMCRTLDSRVGKESELFRLLSPTESEGLLAALRQNVSLELDQQRLTILKEFSLDNDAGALKRLLGQLTDHSGRMTGDLKAAVGELLKQFSFDDEQSALSRMSKTVETTNQAISKHLTLDDENSALSRLKREMLGLIEKQTSEAKQFQADVRATLEKMQVRKAEAAASTRHGLDFEAQVVSMVQEEAKRSRDIATPVGSMTGLIKNCKKGDAVVELGPDSAAAGAKFVVEAKEKEAYSLAEARREIDEARKNRGAECGIFVYSKRTAPADLEPLTRYGHDVIVVWDAEDPATDLYLKVAMSLARALCIGKTAGRESQAVDFQAIDKAILEINKQVALLEDIKGWTETICNNGTKVLERLRISREKLESQARLLANYVEDLKDSLAKERS